LKPQDRFNVIRFDDTMTELFERPVPATAEQVALAVRFTNGLEATGGTEMLPALKEALVDDTPADGARVRQVIFLTDGSISNEGEMLAELSAKRGRSRVFMVGIGSAPNTYLMSHMAEVGRGSFTHISDTATVDARMAELLDRLTRPAVTDLQARLVGGGGEITPGTLPDLYAGEPLVILARAAALSGTLEVSGRIGDRSWSQSVDLSTAVDGPGVARLWARRRVAETEVAERLGTVNAATAAEAIAQLGLRFGMVTRETSLVAIDRTPSRPANARLTEEELPLNLPKGWDFDALFGGNLSDANQSETAATEADEAFELPQTATEAGRLLQSGLALILIALLGLAALRRRPACA
jgi:Ca-activated chloride channel family protein